MESVLHKQTNSSLLTIQVIHLLSLWYILIDMVVAGKILRKPKWCVTNKQKNTFEGWIWLPPYCWQTVVWCACSLMQFVSVRLHLFYDLPTYFFWGVASERVPPLNPLLFQLEPLQTLSCLSLPPLLSASSINCGREWSTPYEGVCNI